LKIEREEIFFYEPNLQQLHLTELQKNYLNTLIQEKTVEKCFHFYLKQGWLINFNELYSLLLLLLKHKAIRNLNFYHVLNADLTQKKGFFDQLFDQKPTFSQKNFELSEQAFFRNLSPNVLTLLKKNSSIISAPANSLILRENGTSREMYFVLQGSLSVFKKTLHGGREKVAEIEMGCVFGEASFFWKAPRGADVVSSTDVQLIRFDYRPEDFDQLIRADVAFKNQVRFWALHAVVKSPILSSLPAETIDELLNSGQSRNLPPQENLFTEGELANSFFIVVQGELAIYQRGKKINHLSQGDVLGEVALFITAGRRSATVVSQTKSVLIEIQRDQFYKLLSGHLLLARNIESLAWERIQNDQKRAHQKAS